MRFRYLYDARSAEASNNPELQSSAVTISVSTIHSNTFLTKLTLTGEVLHEPIGAGLGFENDVAGPKNETLKELTLNFKVVSVDALHALANFTNLERLTIRTFAASGVCDREHECFLLQLLRLTKLRYLSLNYRIQSSFDAELLLGVLRDHNHRAHTLRGVVLDLGDDAAQRTLQEKLNFYLKLNRYGRDLRRSTAPIPWSRVLANAGNRDENHDVLFNNLKAVASLMVPRTSYSGPLA